MADGIGNMDEDDANRLCKLMASTMRAAATVMRAEAIGDPLLESVSCQFNFAPGGVLRSATFHVTDRDLTVTVNFTE